MLKFISRFNRRRSPSILKSLLLERWCRRIYREMFQVKRHWQQNISTFYTKVFDLNRQNVVVWCYEDARNTFETLQK